MPPHAKAVLSLVSLTPGAMDTFARGLKVAAKILSDGIMSKFVEVITWGVSWDVRWAGKGGRGVQYLKNL